LSDVLNFLDFAVAFDEGLEEDMKYLAEPI
jgi:hypothetical protein